MINLYIIKKQLCMAITAALILTVGIPAGITVQAAQSAQATVTLAVPSSSGSLKVQGTKLVDENGQAVQLRGISTHGIAWYPEYVNEEAFRIFRDEWNVNVMRIVLYTAEYNGYCTGGNKDQLWTLVRQGVQYATARDMYTIVDWHILSDGNPNTYKEEAKKFFGDLSKELAGHNNVIYEICNEPNGGTTWDDIKSYANEVIPVIRANSDAVIIVGTPNWSQYVDQAAASPITGYDNIMYSLHFYAATHKDDLRNKMVAAIEKGLPVFVTEYGICDASGNGSIDEAQANQWIETLNRYGVSYVAWNLSNKNETSAIIRSSVTKVNGFTDSDLSASGQWLKNMLTSRDLMTSNTLASVSGNTTTDASTDSSAGSSANAVVIPVGGVTAMAGGGAAQNIANTPAILQDGSIKVSATIVNTWVSNGEPFTQYTLTLENTSKTACSQWKISVPFDGAFKLTDGWNGDYTSSGNTLIISSKSYNGTIPAGGSISDVGFIVSGGTISQ